MKSIKRIYRGARYSERYGYHPGNPFMFLFCLVGLLEGGLLGLLLMLITMGPAYLIACWERGEEDSE